MFKTVLVVLFLVYPSVSATMLSVFNCKDIHGEAYLDADIQIVCYTTMHKLFMVMAAFGMMMYALGIPLGFLWLLYKYQVPVLAKHKRDCHILSRVLEHANTYQNTSDLSK